MRDEFAKSGMILGNIAFKGNCGMSRKHEWMDTIVLPSGRVMWIFCRLFVNYGCIIVRRKCPVVSESKIKWSHGVRMSMLMNSFHTFCVQLECITVLSLSSSTSSVATSLLIWSQKLFLDGCWWHCSHHFKFQHACSLPPQGVKYIGWDVQVVQPGLFCVPWKDLQKERGEHWFWLHEDHDLVCAYPMDSYGLHGLYHIYNEIGSTSCWIVWMGKGYHFMTFQTLGLHQIFHGCCCKLCWCIHILVHAVPLQSYDHLERCSIHKSKGYCIQ